MGVEERGGGEYDRGDPAGAGGCENRRGGREGGRAGGGQKRGRPDPAWKKGGGWGGSGVATRVWQTDTAGGCWRSGGVGGGATAAGRIGVGRVQNVRAAVWQGGKRAQCGTRLILVFWGGGKRGRWRSSFHSRASRRAPSARARSLCGGAHAGPGGASARSRRAPQRRRVAEGARRRFWGGTTRRMTLTLACSPAWMGAGGAPMGQWRESRAWRGGGVGLWRGRA